MALFLDVDGVLLPVPEGAVGAGEPEPTCVAQLKRLTDYRPLQIVLTSTWRLRPDKMVELNALLQEAGVPCIAACTPERATSRLEVTYLDDRPDEQMLVVDRVDEICEWLQDNPQHVWIAVDVMDLGVDHRMDGHFIRPAPRHGLQATDADRGIRLLQMQEAPLEEVLAPVVVPPDAISPRPVPAPDPPPERRASAPAADAVVASTAEVASTPDVAPVPNEASTPEPASTPERASTPEPVTQCVAADSVPEAVEVARTVAVLNGLTASGSEPPHEGALGHVASDAVAQAPSPQSSSRRSQRTMRLLQRTMEVLCEREERVRQAVTAAETRRRACVLVPMHRTARMHRAVCALAQEIATAQKVRTSFAPRSPASPRREPRNHSGSRAAAKALHAQTEVLRLQADVAERTVMRQFLASTF